MGKMLTLAVVTVAVVAVGCNSSDETETTSAGADGEAAVSVVDFAFEPSPLRIAAGTSVTWTNEETGIAHTTTSDDGDWDSKTLQPGDVFSSTFSEPGSFTYHCSIHPTMTATIVVEG